jgi:hypothetical protein
MPSVIARDGTTIAYDSTGGGPALILVGGALEYRAWDCTSTQLAALPYLAEHFTVIG